jgi:hypothetical protein
MGKTTRLHPVSLNVIRGAAEFGGVVFAKIRQVNYDVEANCAEYVATIKTLPEGFYILQPKRLVEQLNSLFMPDVNVAAAWVTKDGNIQCTIQTQLSS